MTDVLGAIRRPETYALKINEFYKILQWNIRAPKHLRGIISLISYELCLPTHSISAVYRLRSSSPCSPCSALQGWRCLDVHEVCYYTLLYEYFEPFMKCFSWKSCFQALQQQLQLRQLPKPLLGTNTTRRYGLTAKIFEVPTAVCCPLPHFPASRVPSSYALEKEDWI